MAPNACQQTRSRFPNIDSYEIYEQTGAPIPPVTFMNGTFQHLQPAWQLINFNSQWQNVFHSRSEGVRRHPLRLLGTERLIDFRLDGQFNPIQLYSLKDTLNLFSSS